MSRIGKQPINIPNGVDVKVENGDIIITKGKLSETINIGDRVDVNIENNVITFSPKGQDRQSRAFWGTYRALTANAIVGLSEGFKKSLEINGVGYRAAVKGKTLELQLGYSHPINFEIPEGIEITVEKNIITVKGNNKQQVGQVAADIRSFRKPEPYKGKGVKYTDEVIIRKAGKTAK
jgi:large subunit ribosomal protein L6